MTTPFDARPSPIGASATAPGRPRAGSVGIAARYGWPRHDGQHVASVGDSPGYQRAATHPAPAEMVFPFHGHQFHGHQRALTPPGRAQFRLVDVPDGGGPVSA